MMRFKHVKILLQILIIVYWFGQTSSTFWTGNLFGGKETEDKVTFRDTTKVDRRLDRDVLQAQAQDRKFKIFKVLKKINKINPELIKEKQKVLKYINKQIPKYYRKFKRFTRPYRGFGGFGGGGGGGFRKRKKNKFGNNNGKKCVKVIKQYVDEEEYDDDYDDDDDYEVMGHQNRPYGYYYQQPHYVPAYPMMPIYHHRRSIQAAPGNRRTWDLRKPNKNLQYVHRLLSNVNQATNHLPLRHNTTQPVPTKDSIVKPTLVGTAYRQRIYLKINATTEKIIPVAESIMETIPPPKNFNYTNSIMWNFRQNSTKIPTSWNTTQIKS